MRVRINYEKLIQDAKGTLRTQGSSLARKVVDRAVEMICDEGRGIRWVAEAWLGNLEILRMTPDKILESAARQVIKDASIDEILMYLEVVE